MHAKRWVQALSRALKVGWEAVRRPAGWLNRRRAVVAHQFLRGASYAAGTTVVGLAAWWIQSRYGS